MLSTLLHREAKIKAKKAIQEANGKRQDGMTKRTKKEQGMGTRRTTKKERKKLRGKKKKKKGEKKRKTARVSGRYYVDYLGLNKGDAS